MRVIVFATAAAILAGCATVPTGEVKQVYDRKYNTYSYTRVTQQSEFVGTASEAPKAKPGWYKFGHP